MFYACLCPGLVRGSLEYFVLAKDLLPSELQSVYSPTQPLREAVQSPFQGFWRLPFRGTGRMLASLLFPLHALSFALYTVIVYAALYPPLSIPSLVADTVHRITAGQLIRSSPIQDSNDFWRFQPTTRNQPRTLNQPSQGIVIGSSEIY